MAQTWSYTVKTNIQCHIYFCLKLNILNSLLKHIPKIINELKVSQVTLRSLICNMLQEEIAILLGICSGVTYTFL